MQLRRTGGKADKGVDFVGWWHLEQYPEANQSSQPQVVRIVGQCKAYRAAIGPSHVREFDAVVAQAQLNSHHPVLGILCSEKGFSAAAYSAMRISLSCLLFYKSDVTNGLVHTALFGNAAAQALTKSDNTGNSISTCGRTRS